MLRKKLGYMLVMLCLVVSAIMTAPHPVAASCSGDDCGCGVDRIECVAECPPDPDPARPTCLTHCISVEARCGICCCCLSDCPTYC